MRAACRDVVAAAGRSGRRLLLLGAASVTRLHVAPVRGTLAGFGVSADEFGDVQLGQPAHGGAMELPLSLTVGAWLVREVLGTHGATAGCSVGPGFAASPVAAALRRTVREETALW